jgi:hypothetical protein
MAGRRATMTLGVYDTRTGKTVFINPTGLRTTSRTSLGPNTTSASSC